MEYLVKDKVKINLDITEDNKYRARIYLATPDGRWLEQPTERYNSREEWLERLKEINEAYPQ